MTQNCAYQKCVDMMRRTRYKLCMETQICGNTITCTWRRSVPHERRVVGHKSQRERRKHSATRTFREGTDHRPAGENANMRSKSPKSTNLPNPRKKKELTLSK